jgi:integrase
LIDLLCIDSRENLAVLDAAVRDRLLDRNPAAGVALPRSDRGERPVPDEVLAELSEHVRGVGVSEGRRLFPTTHSTLGRAWRAAVERAGLPAGTRLRDLRHYYASVLIPAGESVKVVQARLGHASATETLSTYAHLWPSDDDHTREAVARALADSLLTREDHDSGVHAR